MRTPRTLHAQFALAAVAFAACSLVGWMAGMPLLTTWLPGRPALSPMTALLLVLGAAAVAMLPGRRSPALKLAWLEAACGLAIVAAQAADVPGRSGVPPTWWSSALTGMAFALSGASTVLLASGRLAAGQIAAFAVLLLAVLLGLGHVFPSADLYALLPGTGVALPTVCAFIALSLSQLLSFAQTGVSAALTSRNAAGRIGLRLLLAGAAAALLLALAVLAAYQRGFFDAITAVLLLAWALTALLGSALWSVAIAVDRAELAQAAAEREQDEMRQMVTAAITHDLRSPLQAATMTGHLLERLVTDPKAASAIARMQRSHQRLDRLLRSLLDSLLVGSGRELTLRPSRIRLDALVREVIAENEAVLAARTTCEGEAEGWWDRDALFRVIENLLLNAVKYGDSAGAIACRIACEEGERVVLRVTNHGAPIPAPEWDKIFEPFARGHVVRKDGSPGWGVGLAYARSVATAHGGTMCVAESGPERTTFALALPVDSRRWSAATV